MEDRKAQSRLFDQVAVEYDLHRPGYPAPLVEAVVSISGIPENGRILEIGSGTGKATQPFAQRGFSIHCVEPGEHLLAVAQSKFKDYRNVSFELTSFEEALERPETFDLVISAQAWHWVELPAGYAKVARFLKPSGWVALIWNMYSDPQTPDFQEIQQVYRAVVPHMANQDRPFLQRMQQCQDELNASGCFESVQLRSFPWSEHLSARQYLALLDTYSDHMALPAEQKQALYQGIAGVIDRHGGMIEKPYLAVVHLGRKKSSLPGNP